MPSLSVSDSDPSFWQRLAASASIRQSILCVGLDPDPARLPARYGAFRRGDCAPLLRWNQDVIRATARWACAYKPNLGFYLRHGRAGLELLQETLRALPADAPALLDAKFGDVASTAQGYAEFCFAALGVDGVTLNPLLGRDSAEPFFAWKGRGFFFLAHTSNPDAAEFQPRTMEGAPLYLRIAEAVRRWHPEAGLVAGATYPQRLRAVRAHAPDRWILAPGVGRQGGEVRAAVQAGWSYANAPGLLVNVSSRIASADDPEREAEQLVQAMRAAVQELEGAAL